jgi:hypothetical protein
MNMLLDKSFACSSDFPNYLSIIKNFEQRRRLSKLRISAHKLQIEIGRKICFTEPYHDGCLPSYKFLVHLYAALRSGKDESRFSKSTNLAVQSELGRFPLHFDILKQILRFWHRLENLDSSWYLPISICNL